VAAVVQPQHLVAQALEADLDLGRAQPPDPQHLFRADVIGSRLDDQPHAPAGRALVFVMGGLQLVPRGVFVDRAARSLAARDGPRLLARTAHLVAVNRLDHLVVGVLQPRPIHRLRRAFARRVELRRRAQRLLNLRRAIDAAAEVVQRVEDALDEPDLVTFGVK